MEAVRFVRILVATSIAMLAAAGCSLGLGPDRVEEFPMLIRGNVRAIAFVPEDQLGIREVLEGRWTSATEVQLGAVDADELGIPQTIPMFMSIPPGSPNLNVNIETAWLVNDIGTSPEYCVVEAVVLVDETTGAEHTVAEAGDCFDTSISFDVSADIHRDE